MKKFFNKLDLEILSITIDKILKSVKIENEKKRELHIKRIFLK